MRSLSDALDKLDKYRFKLPGHISLEAAEAVSEYVESAEAEIASLEEAVGKADVEVKQLKAELLDAMSKHAVMTQQLGTLHVKLSAIAMLLKG